MSNASVQKDIYNGEDNITSVKQPVLNRWVIVILYGLVASLSTLIHGGFNAWKPVVYKTGAFSEVCNGANAKKTIIGKVEFPSCAIRDTRIDNLQTVAFFIHFFLSFFNGYALDKFGEKLSFLCGQSVVILAFLCLIFIKSSFIWYVFFFLIGLSADLSFLPLLKVSKYFPSQESLIFGILGALRSTGFGIGLLFQIGFFNTFNFGPDDFYILCIVYLLVCMTFSIAVGIFIVPGKEKQINNSDKGSSISKRKSKINIENEMDMLETNKINKNVDEEKTGLLNKLVSLWNHPQRCDYIITILICCSSMIRFEYFGKSASLFFKSDTYDYNNIFSISTVLSFIPTPFFGYLAGKIGSVYSILINNVLIFLAYICILFDSPFLKLTAIVLNIGYFSFAFSCFYCYVDEFFPKKNFGALCGAIFTISAPFLFLNFFLTYLTNEVFGSEGKGNYLQVVCGLTVLGFITLLLCVYLKFTEKKKFK
ncbi:transporter, putative [Hepatocystis sp. ex Piliocolobus tephrosceles]|nr:transporter, putative [Hepatocystis sp. ex Piliocolobus tephrosceles]